MPPNRVSLFSLAFSVSFPSRPESTFEALLPVIRLFSALPVPLCVTALVNVRFSSVLPRG